MKLNTALALSLAAGLAALTPNPARAQPLQDGDIVIGANFLDNFFSWNGRFYRLRGNDLSVLFQTGASGVGFYFPTGVIIDSQGRIVFNAPGCGTNENSSAIDRYNPATGTLSRIACIPYIVGPGSPTPAGMPPEADGFYGLNGLHLTRTLRVTIDDDVNGGVPQVGFADAYGFSVGVHRASQGGQYHPEAFRFLPDTGAIEPGVSLDLLPVGGNQGAMMSAGPSGTYYSNGSKIGLAAPDLSISLNAHTTIGGVDVTVQGTLRVQPQNQILFDGDVLDNTTIPNATAACTIGGQQVTDENVPDNCCSFSVLSVGNIGVLDGSPFGVSNCGCSGVPWLFSLARRARFLNPNCCCYYTCVEHNGPYHFSQDPPPLFNTTSDHGRVLGGDDNGGRVFSVSPSGFQLLASGLGRPRGVAAYPPETPALSSATLVIRIDSPVNVLVTDAAGDRIGYDALGNQVNDFGAGGAIIGLGPEGHPRVYAVATPAEGDYSVTAVGTGTGPYTIRGYRADTSVGGAATLITGNTSPGATERMRISLSPGLGIGIHRVCSADFDGDGDLGTDADIEAFFACLSGNCCLACEGADFNGDGDTGTDADIESFFRVLAGGAC
jgi:hypothetical protein